MADTASKILQLADQVHKIRPTSSGLSDVDRSFFIVVVYYQQPHNPNIVFLLNIVTD